ncbi:MAG TPA: hypothetical protein VLC52_04490, partial [Anaerolineae bacterium]|nr:hypothetical protein [Anaerolineae bacterium]
MTQDEGLLQAREIGVELVRRPFVSWAWVEPVRTEPPTYRWAVHERLENELRQASAAGVRIMLPVLFTPEWAQAVPGSSCGPILDDRMDEFAQFL